MTTTPVRRPMNDSAHHDHSMVPTIKGEVGATVLGPDNVVIGLQNPGAPLTDSGSMPNLKFSFAAAHNRLLPGGWAREVTVRDLRSRPPWLGSTCD
jgi:oxalate decarboxylase